MMGRAAKWKLKFWPDVEVFIFALEITSQIAIIQSSIREICVSGAKCFVSRRIGAVLMSGYEQENVQFEQRAAWGKFEAYVTNSHCICLFCSKQSLIGQLPFLLEMLSVFFPPQEHQHISTISVLQLGDNPHCLPIITISL